MLDERRRLAAKKRRIIVNDDADPAHYGNKGRDEFLDYRFRKFMGKNVDAYFYCVGEGFEKPLNLPWSEKLGDDKAVIMEECRKNGLEVFASLRMADCHDALMTEYLVPYKTENPGLLVAADKRPQGENDYTKLSTFWWSSLNYIKEEVREHHLEFLSRMCSEYNWDGIELDFRHFGLVPFGMEEEGARCLTELISSVRKLIDDIGQKRGRPYLLAVRVPSHISLCAKIGIDIKGWLDGDYLDLLIVGTGSRLFSDDFTEMITLGHNYGVQVYPCFDPCIIYPGHAGEPRLRALTAGSISAMWLDKPDGIYLFNYFLSLVDTLFGEPDDTMLKRLGEMFEYNGMDANKAKEEDLWEIIPLLADPSYLESMDRIYPVEVTKMQLFNEYTNIPIKLPVSLVDWEPVQIKAASPHKCATALLKILIHGLEAHEDICIRLNGERIQYDRRYSRPERKLTFGVDFGGTWFEIDLDQRKIRSGCNELIVSPGINSEGSESTELAYAQLELWQ